MKTSPMMLEILNNKLTSITEEAGFTIKRLAHSLFIREMSDFGTALANHEGHFFAYPSAIGVSNFVDLDCGPTIRAVPDLEPGDVIVTNHPYASQGLSTHTPDINLVVPYFYEGRLVCYGWSFLHISDMGGKVPGSISPTSTEIFQEGVLIPPMKLMRRGEFDPNVLAFMTSNTRSPDPNLGDLKAMLTAHRFAEQRVGEVIAQHGLDAFLQCQEDFIDYSADRTREIMRRIPDGRYEFWDYLDDDLVTTLPVRMRLAIEVEDGLLTLDYTGTDPQSGAAFNVPTAGKRHAFLTAGLMMLVTTLDPAIPKNHGILRDVKVKIPEGTVLNPVWPAATGVRHAAGLRARDVINGALLKAMPDVMPACSAGVIIPVVFAEPASAEREGNVMVLELMMGGLGAANELDGVDGRGGSLANMLNNPLETVEDSASVVVRDFTLVPDSGGAGKWRGGCGISFTFEVLRDGCTVLGRGMERMRFRPWGARGGLPGHRARTILNLGTQGEQEFGKIDVVSLNKGDTLTIVTPGGGGFGDPFERDVEAVRRDVVRGLVSRASAEADYGVSLTEDSAVDAAATARLRGVSRSAPAEFAWGEEREAWETVFDDEAVNAFVEKLSAYPAIERAVKRREVLMRLFPELADRQTAFAKILSPERRDEFVAAVETL
ncbi:hydantoinase B/oxoprolinase family protein [Acuticoccus mangrovi]|uniref:Hydantoinase B/oxoprolinase family protein n=1 Tax=Acuticoccus mangrovi TaxID=2796142 RepID=A0A934IQK6_9HYPH|nr:hydantoinase B/oxoprolinase family protein [Acuticoccus mangrovi]MBJ3776798.1 hydantoinase B/oxoprolinase family protein [Acuticoccus mangrovi]